MMKISSSITSTFIIIIIIVINIIIIIIITTIIIYSFIPGYDNARRMEHTQCLGQSESHVECPSTSWILVHEAYIGYTSNRNDRSRTWCANDRACTQNYDYHKHISTYYRKLSSITVPASRSITCGGQAQSVNYVYFEYSCIPGKQGNITKTVFPCTGFPVVKIRRSWDGLGFPATAV